MDIEVYDVDSIEKLVRQVLDLHSGLDAGRFLWFRGSSCGELGLLPKIMRNGHDGPAVLEREARLLTRFRQRSLPYWPGGYPQNDWEHLFAMQHYGVPTRLLDWSENLFVAAHFATTGSGSEHEHEGPCVPAVWCLDPVGWNRQAGQFTDFDDMHVLTTNSTDLESYMTVTDRKRYATPVSLFGTHNSERIVAQRGTFLVWGKENKSLQGFATGLAHPALSKISLGITVEEISATLQALGFSETMVMPDLSALATELDRVEGWH